MLANLQYFVTSPWDERGVELNHKETSFDDIGVGTYISANFDRNHPFWEKFKDNESNRVMSLFQLKQHGIVAGYCEEDMINTFTDYKVVEEFPWINKNNGNAYSSEDYREMVTNDDVITLPSGRPMPSSTNCMSSYGTADNLQQILKKYKRVLDSEDELVLCIHPVYKSDQPESGGWRWHKNGTYIGNKRSKRGYEYLADEPDIEVVIGFKFIKVQRKDNALSNS